MPFCCGTERCLTCHSRGLRRNTHFPSRIGALNSVLGETCPACGLPCWLHPRNQMRAREWKGFKRHPNREWGSRLCEPTFVYLSRKKKKKTAENQSLAKMFLLGTSHIPRCGLREQVHRALVPAASNQLSLVPGNPATLMAKHPVCFRKYRWPFPLRTLGRWLCRRRLWFMDSARCTLHSLFYFGYRLQKYPRVSPIDFAYWKQVWGAALVQTPFLYARNLRALGNIV